MIRKYLKKSAIFAAISICMFMGPTHAGQRYGTPPPVVLSPDLTAPWVMQLKNKVPVERYSILPNRVSVNKKKLRPFWHTRTKLRQKPRTRTFTAPRFSYMQRRQGIVQRQAPVIRQAAYQRNDLVRSNQQPRQKQSSQRQLDPQYLPQMVAYESGKKPGSIIIDTEAKFLYLVLENGKARRYGVGVGKPGFEWAGNHKITRKAEWPDWRPPAEMIAREKKKGRDLPAFVEGGVHNPLGARALYLGSTLYRIHGTNQPWTIGQAVSSGCIRMRNEDVMDLYDRVGVGVQVYVS